MSALGRFWSHLKPTSFAKGDVVDIQVGQLWSHVREFLPYDFYSLKWCDSTAGHIYDGEKYKNKQSYADNNDSVNTIIHESPFQYKVGQDEDSIVLCT